MTDEIADQPEGATPIDDISGLLRTEITTRKQLDEAETLNILNAVDWIGSGGIGDVFTTAFYQKLHERMFDEVWEWAGTLRSITGARPNIGVAPEMVPMELGRVAMDSHQSWHGRDNQDLLRFIAGYHHALVLVHPFNNGNGRWSRLACDAVVQRLTEAPPITWATDTLNKNSEERSAYIAALRQADEHDLDPLVGYLRALNPDY